LAFARLAVSVPTASVYSESKPKAARATVGNDIFDPYRVVCFGIAF
jgi:hypothetical protein